MKNKLLVFILLLCSFSYSQEKSEIDELREEIKQLKEKIDSNSTSIEHIQNNPIATEEIKSPARIKFSGGGLLRFGEWDVNQQRINPRTGLHYKDRDRFWSRFNFYLGTDIKLTKDVDFHARIRTGNKQYSFVSFGANEDERLNVLLDEFWLNYSYKFTDIRIGRQSASRIWNNQSGVMFDIPTHDGATIISDFKLGNDLNLRSKAAYFVERYANNAPLKDQGKMYGFSLELSSTIANAIPWKISSGIIKAEALPTRYRNDLAQTSDGITRYNDGDLAPDYSIWASQFSIKLKQFYGLSLIVDYYNNLRKYNENPISHMIYDVNGNNSYSNRNEYDSSKSVDFTKQTQGFVATIAVGDQAIAKQIYAGISYLYMEKYAAMDYFAQYDFSRWTSSNIKGPEFSLAYKLNKYLKLRSRLFIAEEIKGLNAIDTDFKRSGTRLRIDMNINF